MTTTAAWAVIDPVAVTGTRRAEAERQAWEAAGLSIDYVEPIARYVRVAPGEKTCTVCGETITAAACPRCDDGGALVPTVSYLRDGEWVEAR